MSLNEDWFKSKVVMVPDFPKPGVVFRDLTPVLACPHDTLGLVIDALTDLTSDIDPIHTILSPESRGFIFGTAMAVRWGLPFIPARKPGKLPRATVKAAYDLEYGKDSIHVHADALAGHERHVLIVDDVLATGGTALACADLVKQLGGVVAGFLFVLEIPGLPGREQLQAVAPVRSLFKF